MTDWVTEPAPGEDKIPPAPVSPEKWSEKEVGVLIDSIHGWRGYLIMVHIALAHGWIATPGDESIITAVRDDKLVVSQAVAWQDLCDEVLDWMNDHLAPEAFQFGWFDGDFVLQSEQWWCAALSPGVCDDPDHTHSVTP